jgi:hypothetical protein
MELAKHLDPVYWAYTNEVLIDGSPFDVKGRTYQQEIMRPVTKDGKVKENEVIRKGSQIGISMGLVIEITHGALEEIYPQGIIYYFPSKSAVEEFSGVRFKPFIKENECVRKHCNDINAVYTRRIGKVNVNFKGGSATTRIGGDAKDSNAMRSTPADWVLLDERDMFDDEMAKQVNQRLGNSKINRRTDLGTPKLPDDGVDRLYKKSDMRRWQIKCDACRKYTCMETEFPNGIGLDANGRGYAKCVHCGRPINRCNGLWIPDYPDRPTVGYWASQMLNPNRNLARVLKEYDDPEAFELNEAEFQRTVLGKAFARADDKLEKSDVYNCCTTDQMKFSHAGPCAMGFDVGLEIHVVIGHRIEGDRFRIVKVATIPFLDNSWDLLHEMAKRFNVKTGVGDAQPERHKIREFAKNAGEYGATVYSCFYSDHLKTFDSWNADEKIVTANRTEIFDETHHMTVNPGRMLIPRRCKEIDTFAHQMCMAAKFLETDKYGNKTYRYKKIGDKQDHYRNALNYFRLACKKIGIPEVARKRRKVQGQDMSYKMGAVK